MSNPSFYHTNYDTICDCSCDCSCETDFGKYRFKVIFKNVFEILIACLFFCQFIIGFVYLNNNIYENIYNISNGTICSIKDNELMNIDIQKLMILVGIFGFSMMISKIINFNFEVYYEYWIITIKISFAFYKIF